MPQPDKKPKKLKEVELDSCPVCGGNGFYHTTDSGDKSCHACHGTGNIKTVDFSTTKNKRVKVENDRKKN